MDAQLNSLETLARLHGALLAERDALKAENERLRQELRVTTETAKALIEGDQKLIDRQQADIARLRAALNEEVGVTEDKHGTYTLYYHNACGHCGGH